VLLLANRQHTINGLAIIQGQVSYTVKEVAVVCFYVVIVLEYQTSFASIGPMGEGERVLSLYVPAIEVEICYKFG